MATISIIVPVYNAENTLRQCVDSILNQEYKNLEVILVDDGSKDGSPAICDEYAVKDKRVKVFHKENGGVSSARNLGLDHAQGEWIAFIDSDDYVSPNYLEAVHNRNEDLIIVPYIWIKGNAFSVDKRTAPFNIIEGHFNIMIFLNKFLTTMIFRAPSPLFFKKGLVFYTRYNEKMKIGEDTCFVHKCLLKVSSMYCNHNANYYYRLDEQGAQVKYNSTTEYAVESLSQIFQSFKENERKWGINKRLFISYLVFFKMICREDWRKKPSKWYRNKTANSFYDYVWPNLSSRQKIKYRLIRLISIFW